MTARTPPSLIVAIVTDIQQHPHTSFQSRGCPDKLLNDHSLRNRRSVFLPFDSLVRIFHQFILSVRPEARLIRKRHFLV
eukprot:scaffold502300_cov19-Prasinocladus_malaysianus.AAC.2